MKKFLSLFMVLVMICCLCGCLGENNNVDDIRGEITSEVQNVTQGEETEDGKNEESQPEFSLGKTINNVYTNEFLGLSCTLSSEWEFYSDEQILELNNIVLENIDEDISEQIKNATIIYDMFAQNTVDYSNINMTLERFSSLQIASIDMKQSLEAQKDAIISTYQNMGYTDITVAYEKIIVDNKEYDALKLKAMIQGVDFYGTAFAFKKNNYVATVTVTSLQTDKTDDILKKITVE